MLDGILVMWMGRGDLWGIVAGSEGVYGGCLWGTGREGLLPKIACLIEAMP